MANFMEELAQKNSPENILKQKQQKIKYEGEK